MSVLTDAPAAGGSFTLSYDGQTTAAITLSSTTSTQATDIQTALRALSTIGSNNVTVAYDSTSASTAPRFLVTFAGTLANQSVKVLTASGASLQHATVTPRVVTSGRIALGETQTVTLTKPTAAGTFTLSLTHNSVTYTTTELAFSATAADIQTALNTALASLSGATAIVNRFNGTELSITFAGTLAGVDLANLTGTVTGSVTPAGLTQTVEGFNRAEVPSVNETLVVDYKADPLTIPAGSSTFTFNMDGKDGQLTKASGTLSGTVASFANVTGNFSFQRTVKEGVTRLTVGATGVTAFVGNNFGATNATGVELTGGKLGLVVLEKTASVQAKYALAASGTTGLKGLSDFTLSGNLDLQVQRFGAAINETITVGSDSVIVKFDDATERTRLSGTITLGTPVADLSGAFAVEATGASPDRRLFIAASGVTAFVGKGKDTTITTDDVGVSFSNGEMLAVINASGTYAFDASGTAGLTGIDSISLTGTLVAQKNTTGSAVSEDLTIGGTTKTLTVAKDVSKVSGTLTLSTENSLYLTGTIGVEKKTASLKLEDGTTVNTTAVQLGGTGISGFVGLNATPGHTDQTGVSLSNLSFGYTLASPTNSDAGKDLRTWSALKAAASSASLVGVDVVTATVSSLHLNLNRAGGTKDGTAATKTADFASSPLANTVGGQSSTLDFVGSILQAFALIEFSVSGFASIRGRFGIDLGNMDVKLPSFPDVDLPTSFLRMWGIDVDVSVGINGPSWSSPDFTGFDLRDVDFNLQINTRNPFTGLLPQLGAMKWFTLEASIPELTFAPFLDILAPTIDATIPKLSLNLTFDVPTGIDPIPYIDYRLSLPTVTLPAMPAMPNFPGLPDLPALPSITGFSFNMPPVELLQIGNIPSLNLFNFLSVTGSLTFKRVEYTAKLQDGSSVETWRWCSIRPTVASSPA
ncbi:MAG UNVERIFIED_CONTAM: hypothetical protein LVR18_46900 [Planctomycetaceae bacterium]